MDTDISNKSGNYNYDVNLIDIYKITERIIKCAFAVSNSLGVGFLVKVYENALALGFKSEGITYSQQHPLPVYYRSHLVGDNLVVF